MQFTQVSGFASIECELLSVLAVPGFFHANCSQALGEVLGNEELWRDNNVAGLVDISKLLTLRKAPRKIGFIVFEQMTRTKERHH